MPLAAAGLTSPVLFTTIYRLPTLRGHYTHFCRRSIALPSTKTAFSAPVVLHNLGARAMAVVGSAPANGSGVQNHLEQLPETELSYFKHMSALKSSATFLALLKEGDRSAVIVDRTIFHPQGGGQPADQGFISPVGGDAKFRVEDVRAKNGLVYHYGDFESFQGTSFQKGQEVTLSVDGSRRAQNSRLHSAGHLLDACTETIGLTSLERGKGHHFPDGPFVEYHGTVPTADIERKRAELEAEVNRLVAIGGSVQAVVVPYKEAADLCGGSLPDYIPKESTPRIVTLAGLACPCGGTHVSDVSDIGRIKVAQIRVKKGLTKVSYTIGIESQ